jgi:hypothetical protein
MIIRLSTRRVHAGGFTIIECIMYIALLGVVLGVSTGLFFQTWSDSNALRRDASDIVRVLHAGDQWRSDIRAASGAIRLTDSDGLQQVHIPETGNEVVYSSSNGQLRRQSGAHVERIVLENVKTSRMESESRHDLTAWKWELELKIVKKKTPWRPLFTFESVAGGGNAR